METITNILSTIIECWMWNLNNLTGRKYILIPAKINIQM